MRHWFSALGLWTWSSLSWWLDELQSKVSQGMPRQRGSILTAGCLCEDLCHMGSTKQQLGFLIPTRGTGGRALTPLSPLQGTARKGCRSHPLVVSNTSQKGCTSLATAAPNSDCVNLLEITWPKTHMNRKEKSRKNQIWARNQKGEEDRRFGEFNIMASCTRKLQIS